MNYMLFDISTASNGTEATRKAFNIYFLSDVNPDVLPFFQFIHFQFFKW